VRVSTYAEIAALAAAVRPTLVDAGVRFHRDSPLGKLVREAETLARDWEAGRSDGDMRRLVDAHMPIASRERSHRLRTSPRLVSADGGLRATMSTCRGGRPRKARTPSPRSIC
jgi:hypothetical protein